jgi:cephalosporin hydroxylase
MKIVIDLSRDVVEVEDDGAPRKMALASPEAFSAISKAWLRCGWDNKYVYSFSWMGRPIIQLPDDMIRIQEVIYAVKPDVIIETGIAHGGSLVYYASLCKAMGKGRIIGIDVEIRPHNRKAIEAHELASLLTLIEGSSSDPETVRQVAAALKPQDSKVLVFLDSCHTKAHVLAELEAYSKFVSVGSYIVAMDGIQKDLVGAPRSQPDWAHNNPTEAAKEFAAKHPEFVIEDPALPFNEGGVTEKVTYWPGAYLKRVR